MRERKDDLDGDGGGGFYPPDEFIPSESVRNHEAAVFVASIADCPTKIVGVECSLTAAAAAD